MEFRGLALVLFSTQLAGCSGTLLHDEAPTVPRQVSSRTSNDVPPADKSLVADVVRFRAVETEAGEHVEVRVGDIVFVAPQIEFRHQQMAPSRMTAVNGKIQLIQGASIMSAKEMTMAQRGGLLGYDPAMPRIGETVSEGLLDEMTK